MAIVGISSIHLLKTFIEVGDLAARGATPSAGKNSVTDEIYTWDGVLWQVIIHMVFILSAIALAWIDRMSQSARHAPADSPSAAEPALPVAPAPHLALDAPHRGGPVLASAAADHLLQLGQLRDAGVVTEVEFAAKKSELLARL
ncbi:MAG TPA: hypothetical protein VFC59_10170 [Cryobacterium sp.]|nr:hypothetical protein [Cryobacterium sp.]